MFTSLFFLKSWKSLLPPEQRTSTSWWPGAVMQQVQCFFCFDGRIKAWLHTSVRFDSISIWMIWRAKKFPFKLYQSPCWVMVILKRERAPKFVRSMWNWVGGLKSPVCSESMHVLARLLIVQPDHTYANQLSWSQSTERIIASIRHTESLYTGPYNHSAELRASGEEKKKPFFFIFNFSIQILEMGEREREGETDPQWNAAQMFLVISSPHRTQQRVHGDRAHFFFFSVNIWALLFHQAWRTSIRPCFQASFKSAQLPSSPLCVGGDKGTIWRQQRPS